MSAISRICLLGFLVSFYYFFPGFMSFDSIVQYEDALNRRYGDWHPPIMSWAWSVLLHFSTRTWPLLAIQLALFWGSLGVLASLWFKTPTARVLAVILLGFYPPVFSHLGILWKDTQMAIAIVFALAVALVGVRAKKIEIVYFSLAPLFFAFAVRHNAPPSLFPVLAGVAFAILAIRAQAAPRPRVPRTSPLALGVLLFVLFFLGSSVLSWALVGTRSYPVQQILGHDLVGLSLMEERNFLPSFMTREGEYTRADLERMYDAADVIPLYSGDPKYRRLSHRADPDGMREYFESWMSAVVQHPVSYLRLRLGVWKEFLSLGTPPPGMRTFVGIVDNKFGLAYNETPARAGISRFLRFTSAYALYDGWFCLTMAIACALLGWFSRKTNGGLALLLGCSAVLYELPYFFIATSCDFRFHLWTCVASGLGLLSLCRSPERIERL